MKKGLGFWAAAAFVLSLVVAFVVPLWWRLPQNRLITWAVVAGATVLALVALLPTDKPSLRNILVNENNRYSDAQLITFGWFVTIVSAYLACAMWNVAVWKGDGDVPIAIVVPESIWALAGIVSTTLVGTSIVQAYKRRTVGITQQTTAPAQPKSSPHPILQRGLPQDASPSDLVTYDEGEGLQDKPNLGAIQQLLFQITALAIYIVALGRMMNLNGGDGIVKAFPALDPGFLTLLGLSTLAALIHRAVPR